VKRLPRVALGLSILCFPACALVTVPPTPVLPERFEGPLSASADTVIASTQALRCTRALHLDFGRTPQGCTRAGADTAMWVNWTGVARVTKIGRDWTVSDGAAAQRVALDMRNQLARSLGGEPVECTYPHNPTWRELRWIATSPDGISTTLRIEGLTNAIAPAHFTLIRTLGPEACGYHADRPWR
jgi:hypothetical protein